MRIPVIIPSLFVRLRGRARRTPPPTSTSIFRRRPCMCSLRRAAIRGRCRRPAPAILRRAARLRPPACSPCIILESITCRPCPTRSFSAAAMRFTALMRRGCSAGRRRTAACACRPATRRCCIKWCRMKAAAFRSPARRHTANTMPARGGRAASPMRPRAAVLLWRGLRSRRSFRRFVWRRPFLNAWSASRSHGIM